MKKIRIKSFCKINLSLKVLKKLKNDYHSIESLVTFCNLHDVIEISRIKGKKDKINFSGKFKKGINLYSNTITKVLNLLRKKNIINNQKFKITVQKDIPHGSGLGGASSNAASLLNFLNVKMNLKLSTNQKNKIAKNVGFDVPVCLKKQNTLLTGKKGEILRLNKKFNLNILIVYPNIACSTKKIYEKNKKFSPLRSNFFFNIKNKNELINLLFNENNDLQEAVIKFYPRIRKIIDFISDQEDCYFSRITGSGSACIGIFSNMKAAIYTQKLIKSKFPKYWSATSRTI